MLKDNLQYVNIPRVVCNHLVGKQHTTVHRLVVGIGIMLVGVIIAKHFRHSSDHLVAHVGDCIGYGLHGLGLTPFVEAMLVASAE